MEESFWQRKWGENDIAFHESEANPLLLKHIQKLALNEGDRVFVPLCGKTLDIGWLLSNGFRVAGAELSQLAVQQLFQDLGVQPRISTIGKLTHYSAPNLDIFVGNIFELSADVLGRVEAIYDRAALVALPEEMRRRYSAHIVELTERAPQLMICYVYDQSSMKGPPFSIRNVEVAQHYAQEYHLSLISSEDVQGGLKGNFEVKENVWVLDPRG